MLTASRRRPTFAPMERMRGTCVAVDGRGVLLRGPSGAGKSDLALRLIDGGARLVSDDYTDVALRDGRLFASAPPEIRGILEVRGLGVLRMGAEPTVPLALAVDLVAASGVERMPAEEVADILGIAVPVYRLAAHEASAPAKVRLAVRLTSGGIMRVP